MSTCRHWAAVCLFACALLARAGAAQVKQAADEWYLPVADGCRLYVYEVGSGPDTVIVLHGGFGAEHSYMLDAVDGLTDSHRFVFYDQRGSLRSPCADSSISVARHVDDLERLRQALGVERATLLAHSMGTVLAVAYLSAHPDHTGGLVLTGTVPPDPRTAADTARSMRGAALAKAFIERPAIQAELAREHLDRPREQLTPQERTHAWRVRYAGANMYHVERWRRIKGGQVFYNAHAGEAAARSRVGPHDPVPILSAHACALTVIAGTHDFIDMDAARHREWTARVPHAQLVIIPNAGHNAWLDEPDLFRRAVAAGLAGAARCRG